MGVVILNIAIMFGFVYFFALGVTVAIRHSLGLSAPKPKMKLRKRRRRTVDGGNIYNEPQERPMRPARIIYRSEDQRD